MTPKVRHSPRVRQPSLQCVADSSPPPAPETVRAGDSLHRIAARRGVRAVALERANPSLSILQPGDQVIIPRDRPSLCAPDFRLSRTAVAPAEGQSERQFTEDELWPAVRASALRYGVPALVIMGIIMQESSGINRRVHRDGTGRGFTGLDTGGQLRDFSLWSGEATTERVRVRRGRRLVWITRPRVMAAVPQIEFLALRLSEMRRQYDGSLERAVSAWHTGGRFDADYIGLVQAEMQTFHHEGARTIP